MLANARHHAAILLNNDGAKILALCFLVLQNAGLVMLMRYVRTRQDRAMFLASTAVMMDEALKFYKDILQQ